MGTKSLIRLGNWKEEEIIPKFGWNYGNLFVIEDDLPKIICEMCLARRIRYVHSVIHPEYNGNLLVGYVCAEHLTGDSKMVQEVERFLVSQRGKKRRLATRIWHSCKDGRGTKYLTSSGYCIYVRPIMGSWVGEIIKDDGTYRRISRRVYNSRLEVAFAALKVIEYHLKKELLLSIK
jgi:hypothetical protein